MVARGDADHRTCLGYLSERLRRTLFTLWFGVGELEEVWCMSNLRTSVTNITGWKQIPRPQY